MYHFWQGKHLVVSSNSRFGPLILYHPNSRLGQGRVYKKSAWVLLITLSGSGKNQVASRPWMVPHVHLSQILGVQVSVNLGGAYVAVA